MSPNSHSHDDQESNKFVNSNRTFYNSVQKFIKKVKNTFKAQETQKIDNHIDAMKSGKKSHAVEFQDKALNFLKDVWIFFCKAARFIIKAFRTLFNIVKPHAIKAFNQIFVLVVFNFIKIIFIWIFQLHLIKLKHSSKKLIKF